MGLTPGGCFNGTQSEAGKKCSVAQTIPHSLFDPNGFIFLNTKNGMFPAVTNTANDTAQATVSLPFKVRDDVVRIDYNINDKWAILGHNIGDNQNQG
jgi:hypothetical protein